MSTEVLVPRTGDDVHYPDSDGKPMGETPLHIRNMFYSLYPLQRWFEHDDQVFVAANMFVYYVKGDPTKHVSPDLFVAKNVPREKVPPWRKYLVWEHGKGPDAVFEYTSESTRDEDVDKKKVLYQDVLKVPEYFLFDPWDEYLVPRLQGYRLVHGLYQRIPEVDGRLWSEVLGLFVEAEGELLRFVDPRSGQWLPIPPELEAARTEEALGRRQAELARERAQAEAQRLRQAEAARERLLAEAERLRREAEATRARAQAEADRLRQEVAELRKRLASNGGSASGEAP